VSAGEPEEFTITSDHAAVDVDAVHAYLRTSYWAEDIPRDLLARAIANSIPFSVLHGAQHVGFARVVTDRATFAYLADVYVLEAYRGRGLARRLMDAVMAHPDLQGLRRFSLITRDAEGLYRRFGFAPLAAPARHLEIVRPGMYRQDLGSRTGT
jgi:ribosomal protein S18 acetylase RimI-like enzyme